MHDTATVYPSTQELSVIDLLSSPSLKAKRRTVAAGTILCEPDDPSTNLYFVESGQVRVYQVGADDCGRLLEILGPNDWFGIAALAQSARQGVRAVAVAASVIWEVPADGL